MIKPAKNAIAAGMSLTLALGMTPAIALAADGADSAIVDADSQSEGVLSGVAPDPDVAPPAAYDKADFYSDSSASAAISLFAMPYARGFSPVHVSDEMRYFAKWESHSNYNQGLSAGDGYHAMGYYQFDNRYGLDDFLISCYEYDPQTYAMFAWVRTTDITGSLCENDALTSVGVKLDDSWHKAYAADPAGFSALQDSWAYEQYYLPAERYLSSIGIDISDRNDAVKGLCWGLSNLFGTSGWKKFVGGISDGYDWNGVYHYLKEGYRWPGAGLSDDMTDAEFVSVLCDYVVDNVAVFYKGQPQYHKGWQNRYRGEKAQCLDIIERTGDTHLPAPEPEPEPKPEPEPEEPSAPENPETPDEPETPGAPEEPGSDDEPNADGEGVQDEPGADDEDADGEPDEDTRPTPDGEGSSSGNAVMPAPQPMPPAANGNGISNAIKPSAPVPPANDGTNGGIGSGDASGEGEDGGVSGNGSEQDGSNGAASEKPDDSTASDSDSDKKKEPPADEVENDNGSDDGSNANQGDKDFDGEKPKGEKTSDAKDTIVKTNDESAGIVAALVGGFALAFGIVAGTLRRMLGKR